MPAAVPTVAWTISVEAVETLGGHWRLKWRSREHGGRTSTVEQIHIFVISDGSFPYVDTLPICFLYNEDMVKSRHSPRTRVASIMAFLASSTSLFPNQHRICLRFTEPIGLSCHVLPSSTFPIVERAVLLNSLFGSTCRLSKLSLCS